MTEQGYQVISSSRHFTFLVIRPLPPPTLQSLINNHQNPEPAALPKIPAETVKKTHAKPNKHIKRSKVNFGLPFTRHLDMHAEVQ